MSKKYPLLRIEPLQSKGKLHPPPPAWPKQFLLWATILIFGGYLFSRLALLTKYALATWGG